MTGSRLGAAAPLATGIAMALTPGCGSKEESRLCTLNYVYGLVVDVADGSSDCADLVLVAADGDYTEALVRQFDCTFVGAGERPGHYLVTVADDDGVLATELVTVSMDERGCHPEPEHVSIYLERDGAGGAAAP